MRLLDETDAKTILLIAPAGYGKTTLARQWIATVQTCVSLTLTPGHRDVAWLAEELARQVDAIREGASGLIRAHVSARPNPQRAPRAFSRPLAEQLNAAGVSWVALDDYHEIAASSEAEELIESLEGQSKARFVIASRMRPAWATGRRYVYNEIAELGREDLAMTADEATRVVGKGSSAAELASKAQGWPAVIGLAASANANAFPRDALPQALHRYLAEELFSSADASVQDALLTLALLGDASSSALQAQFGESLDRICGVIRDLGFGSGETGLELHPLLIDFLLDKLREQEGFDERVRRAVELHLVSESWDRALDLIVRFELADLVEPALQTVFHPLSRSGRLETLAAFARATTQDRADFPSPSVDVVFADAALRDGNFELAADIGERACSRLSDDHPLLSPASAIVGQSAFLRADFESAGRWFEQAKATAHDNSDETEALHGLAVASIFGEHPSAATALAAVGGIRHRSPTDYLRFATSSIGLQRLGGSPGQLLEGLHLDAAREAWARSESPRARTAFAYNAAAAFSQRADYPEAQEWLALFFQDAEEFGLEFAMPYANWVVAHIAMGFRRYGEAERALQAVEDSASRTGDRHHQYNAAALRARLLVQNGDSAAAVRCLRPDPDAPVIPSWRGEYFASRAIAHACCGDVDASRIAMIQAEKASIAFEVRVLNQVAVATTEPESPAARRTLIGMARQSSVWDPVVCGLRASERLALALTVDVETRTDIEHLCRRIGDLPLARRLGLRARSTSDPRDVLSPREREVLGLIARGCTNRQISAALFITPSTTKVHVRHILEKLGVHTRAEAVARMQAFGATGDE